MEEKGAVSGERGLLRMLIRDMKKFPVLTVEEEVLLARQARDGDKAAANRLVESNLRFVLKIVFKYRRPGFPMMDLISQGCLGAMRATRTFDPDMGFRFVTYAGHWINQFVQRAMMDYSRHQHSSLDDLAFGDDEDTTFKDLLVSDDPAADVTISDKQVRRMLSELNDRERTIIILRFWHDLNLEEVGDRIGLTKDRVRQIESRSLRKMRWANPPGDLVPNQAQDNETLDMTAFAGCKP